MIVSLSELAMKIAVTQIGESEQPKGSNSGPMVDQYLASVGLDPGYAWCMAFVYWCHRTASLTARLHNTMPKHAGVIEVWRRSFTYRVEKPAPGDVFVMDYGGGKGHTGFVESINTDGSLNTIEGNSNSDGSREGFEVCRHKRHQSKILGYLRF